MGLRQPFLTLYYCRMIALIAVTALFNSYIREEHFRVAKVLSSMDCFKLDLQADKQALSKRFKGKFTQPELRHRTATPKDIPTSFTDERLAELGLLGTPIEYTASIDEQEDEADTRNTNDFLALVESTESDEEQIT